jgi:hypothetical protein
MDDDKTIIEKFTDAVKGAASTIVDAASNAAGGTMQTTAKKISPDGEHVAATGNEQIFIPEATDAVAVPPPLFPLRKSRKVRASKRPAKTRAVTRARKASPKKSAKKSSRKPAVKKTAKRPAKASRKKKTRRG